MKTNFTSVLYAIVFNPGNAISIFISALKSTHFFYKKEILRSAGLIFLCLSGMVSGAQISGIVFRDYNANGKKDNTSSFNERGEPGIIVTAYNSANTIMASYKTSVAGNYTFPASGSAYNGTEGSNTGFIPSGTAVRIEFSGWKTGDFPAPIGIDNKGNVQFAIAPASSISFAVNYPDEFAQTNPRLATNVYKKGHAPLTEPVVVSVDYTASGGNKNFPNISVEATQSQLGATYGLAHHRLSNTLFASSYQKRHTSYGSANSTGAIYKMVNPTDNSTTGTSLFVDLNVLYGSNVAGNNPHPNGVTDFTRDDASYGLVGKIGFGDLDISEDGKNLWTINLNDRYLYKIPLGSDPYNPVAPAASCLISRYPLWNLCDANNNGLKDLSTDIDIRPFAIKPYHGKVYIGVICTAQSTPTVFSNLTARVFEFDPISLIFTEVLNFPLNYNRGNGNTSATPYPNGVPAGSGYTNANAANWRPWNDIYTTAATFKWSWYDASWREGGYSQPIFAGLDFDDTGNMIIGLRDRFGDMLGDGVYDPGGNILMEADGNGDLVRAVLNGAGTGWNFITSEATNGTEFFVDDNFGSLHEETSMGGLAIYHGAGHIISTTMDPVSNLSGGFDWTRFSDGKLDRSYEVIRRASGDAITSHMFAKANALGEIELLSSVEQIQIGNRIWNDINKNGIQDADEPGIPNVVIQLTSPGADLILGTADDIILATTTSDINGDYNFKTLSIQDSRKPINWTGSNDILPGFDYQVRIATNQIALTTPGLSITQFDMGTKDNIDNDGKPQSIGINNYSLVTINTFNTIQDLDFGFGKPIVILPLKLQNFSAQPQGNNVILNWVINEETDAANYEVEYSKDGVGFISIGSVTANKSHNYNFLHTSPIKGINYYRLKLIDKEGKANYSEIRIVNFGKMVSISIFPNPTTDFVNITLAAGMINKPVAISVIAMDGKVLLAQKTAIANQTETINLHRIALMFFTRRSFA